MKWKEFVQKYLPYSIYGMFAFILVNGFPTIYINQVGDYISSQFVIPAYFIFCFVLVACFAKNKSAKKYKWTASVVSLCIIESFFFLLFLQYYFVTAIIIIGSLIAIGILLYYQMRKIRPPKRRTDRFLKFCRDRTAVICAYLSVVILLIPSAIGFYKEYIDVFSMDDWTTLLEMLADEDDTSISSPPDALALELSEWNDLSVEDRFELLCKVGVREEKILGIENYAEIRMTYDKFNKFTLAYYDNEEKLICININELTTGGIEESVNALIHEVFHAYQHYVVSSLNFESDLVKNSYYYEDAREWKYNMDNYVSGYVDFSAYEEQPLETDARSYAAQRTPLYILNQG